MYKILLKNKKGFTIVELLVVLVLLSFGVLALGNMFRVTYRAFQKSEERSRKQEAVKRVAELLQDGSEGVCSAQTADVFDTVEVVPTANAVDTSYSYLYSLPNYPCEKCGKSWNTATNKCSDTQCNGTKGALDGYFVCVQDKGTNRNSAKILSDVPIYIKIKPYIETSKDTGEKSYYSGVIVTLAALEDDFEYEKKDAQGNVQKDGNGNVILNKPISDDIYYSLDVAYHFPNMATSKTGVTVNHLAKGIVSTATKYDANGNEQVKIEEKNGQKVEIPVDPAQAADEGVVLRVYCDSIIGADVTNAEPTLPTLCFIATASYGHDSSEVGLLCKFRDECLLTNFLGTAFVNAYYKLSPPIAEFISESEPLKAAVRVALKPLVAIATNALNEDVAKQNVVWFAMFMLCGAGATATLIKVDKRRKNFKE